MAMHVLDLATELGMMRLILETDAFNLGQVLTSTEMDRAPEGAISDKLEKL